MSTSQANGWQTRATVTLQIPRSRPGPHQFETLVDRAMSSVPGKCSCQRVSVPVSVCGSPCLEHSGLGARVSSFRIHPSIVISGENS